MQGTGTRQRHLAPEGKRSALGMQELNFMENAWPGAADNVTHVASDHGMRGKQVACVAFKEEIDPSKLLRGK